MAECRERELGNLVRIYDREREREREGGGGKSKRQDHGNAWIKREEEDILESHPNGKERAKQGQIGGWLS